MFLAYKLFYKYLTRGGNMQSLHHVTQQFYHHYYYRLSFIKTKFLWYLNVNNVPYLNCQKYFKINLFSCCRNLSLSVQDQLKSCRVCLCLKVSVKGVVCVSPIILCTDCYVSWYGATQTNKMLHLPYLHLPSHSHTHSNQYQGWY